MKSIAILANPNNEQAVSECEIVAGYLKGKGVSSSFGSLSDDKLRKQVEKGEVDLVITLGGDGTVLRAGHLCAQMSSFHRELPLDAIQLQWSPRFSSREMIHLATMH